MSRETQRISISEPTNDPDALWRAVVLLKEAVEVLQGIRGNRADVTQNEYDKVIADLDNTLAEHNTRLIAGGL